MKRKAPSLLCFAIALVMTDTHILAQSSDVNSRVAKTSPRDGKLGWVGAEALGFTFFPVQGIRGGYFLNKDFSIGASYASGTALIGDLEFSKTVFEVGAKYFFGESFYLDGNLAMESFESVASVISTDFSRPVIEGETSSTGLSFHIGNQWQWDNFTLGCDWVGYYLSLSESVDLEAKGSVSSEEIASTTADVETNLTGNSLHLARFYLGWAF